MSYGVGRRCGLDPAFLWLWYKPAAEAPIRPLAWEHPQAVGVALNETKQGTFQILVCYLGERLQGGKGLISQRSRNS